MSLRCRVRPVQHDEILFELSLIMSLFSNRENDFMRGAQT